MNTLKEIGRQFKHWLLHVFSVHCEVCRDHMIEDNVCTSCDVLKQLLEVSNSEKRRLMDLISELNRKPEVIPDEAPSGELRPIPGQVMGWRQQRAILEANSRRQAAVARAAKEKIAKDGAVTAVADTPSEQTQDIIEDVKAGPVTAKPTLVVPMSLEELERDLGVAEDGR